MRIVKGFTLVLGLLCLIVGVVGLLWVLDTRDVRGDSTAAALDITRKTPAAPIKKLYIRSDIGMIRLTPTDGDEIVAHLTGTVPADAKWDLQTDASADGTWKVSAMSDKNRFHIGIDLRELLSLARSGFDQQLILEVAVPRKNYEEMTVRTDTGKLELGDVKATVLDAQADTGAIDLASFEGRDLSLEADTGSIEFKNVQASGKIDVHSDTGRIDGALKTLAGQVKLDASTGAVALKLPPDASAQIELKSDIGSISVNAPSAVYDQKDRNSATLRMGTGTYPVQIETDIGAIRLEAR